MDHTWDPVENIKVVECGRVSTSIIQILGEEERGQKKNLIKLLILVINIDNII